MNSAWTSAGLFSSYLLLALPASAKSGDDGDDSGSESSAESSSDTERAEADPASSDERESETKTKANAKGDASNRSEASDDKFGHQGQFNLRAALVGAYRMVLRFDDSPYCHEYDLGKAEKDQLKTCGFGAPFALDLGLGFGVLDSFEPFLWARLGLGAESKTDTKPLMIVGAGTRLYTMSDSAFKIYLEPALGLELEKGRGNYPNGKSYKQDLIFHFAAGPQLDVAKNVGIYADAGLTLGVLREIQGWLEAKVGVQGRLP